MKTYKKFDFPVERIRHYLEPGPIVLVSSAWKGRTNVMTMGWHCVMEFSPSLVGCIIASSNHTFDMVRRSKECAINIPTVDIAETVVGIGNCDGDKLDKFKEFDLTATPARHVKASLIAECPVSLECKLHDSRLINKYNFFIWEVVKAHAARSPKFLKTIHYHGRGMFTVAGPTKNLRRLFTKWPD
jgi:flavin reductase (DIM6/NTAB) family NADH-FMN oxidoreductase RutF